MGSCPRSGRIASPLSKPYGNKALSLAEDKSIGLYLHVPFCLRKCPYCSFFSETGSPKQFARFIQAVQKQAEWIIESGHLEGCQVDTIFIGGGTPSLLGPEQLRNILDFFHHNFVVRDRERETSVEVNPATVNLSELSRLRSYGYNRISIGVQSLCDEELVNIGRPHSAADAAQTSSDARKAGFLNCNVDLMYGLPGQTVASWNKTLNKALDLDPDHLAIYELTVEEGTPFDLLNKKGKLNLPMEDEVMEMMTLTERAVAQAGYTRYEISNYARPGKECHHNINYWKNGWYVGLGPGGVSCLAGRRYTAVQDVEEFCRKIASKEEWWSDLEELDREARFRETVVMGLRMIEGVSISGLFNRFGINPVEYYGSTLNCMKEQNLIELQHDRMFLTPKGMNLANQVMAELV